MRNGAKSCITVVVRLMIIAIISALVLGAALTYTPYRYVLWQAVGGRISSLSPACSLRQVLADAHQYGNRIATEEDFSRRLRITSSDRKCSLWEVPGKAQAWFPSSTTRDMVAMLLAEANEQIYGDPPCRAGDVVLDCGAHVGLHSRAALRAGAALVVAIEPAAENLECLRRNLAAEIAQQRVNIVDKGVWEREGVLKMVRNPANSAADRISDKGTDTMAVTTIDQIVAELGRPVHEIKMDIEGAERNALKGAVQTLRRFRPRLAIAGYHRPDDPEALTAIIRGAWPGYSRRATLCGLWTECDRLLPQVMQYEPGPR